MCRRIGRWIASEARSEKSLIRAMTTSQSFRRRSMTASQYRDAFRMLGIAKTEAFNELARSIGS